jgi:hypothetical protein
VPGPPLPSEIRDWSAAAIKLLQGVVYSDDVKVWNALLQSVSPLESYFGRMGLSLIIDEPDGYAYLRQWEPDELPEGHEQLPKLMRKTPLGYAQTLLCVLLRDELRRFEEEEVHNERCVVETQLLLEQWHAFFPVGSDEVRRKKDLTSALSKIEELGFIVKFSAEPESWEIRRALKARLPVAELEKLKEQLVAAAALKAQGDPT